VLFETVSCNPPLGRLYRSDTEARREWAGTSLSQKALAPRLQQKGLEKSRTKNGFRWNGLGLLVRE
jgi:hypothetical protein